MMRKFHECGFDTADSILQGLARVGYSVSPGIKVLDFGCGAGALVYRFLDLGFDAYGFDIHNRANLRDAKDRDRFRFFANQATDPSDHIVSEQGYELPFPRDSFDLVVSSTVLEHVMDWDLAMKNIARVLCPSGVALHVFPGRECLIEPHIFVPLATRLQSWHWLYFWALLGVRNEFQKTMTARQRADINAAYCRTGIHYESRQTTLGIASKYFGDVSFVTDRYYEPHSWSYIRPAIWKAIRSKERLSKLSQLQRLSVLLTAAKRP